MKANRISKVDTSLVGQSPTRAYGAPQMAGIDFDGATNTLNIFPDSPNADNARKLAIGGYKANGVAATLASTIDWGLAVFQSLTLANGTNVLTFSNGVAGQRYALAVTQGDGSDLVTWPAAVKWTGGSAPTLTTTAARTDLVEFVFDGTNYLGATVALNYTL